MPKPGDHYDVEDGGDVRLNGQVIGNVTDGNFVLFSADRPLTRIVQAGPANPGPRGPLYQGWGTGQEAEADVYNQARRLERDADVDPDAMVVVMNSRTRKHLASMTLRDHPERTLGSEAAVKKMLSGDWPESILGLPIVIDENSDTPTVRAR